MVPETGRRNLSNPMADLLARWAAVLAFAWLLIGGVPSSAAEEEYADIPRVLVDVFLTPGCDECAEAKGTIIPELTNVMGNAVDLQLHDLHNPTNFLLLTSLQEQTGGHPNETVFAFVNRRYQLAGLSAMRARLISLVADEFSAGAGPAELPELDPVTSEKIVADRFGSFTVSTVCLAGLVDGVNPCAFATIVFFITLLSVAKRTGREILVTGAAFCLAVFLTYFLLGLGAFRVLHSLQSISWTGTVIKAITVAALLCLAALSFRDAWHYKRTGKAHDVTLQIPDRLKRKIHSSMRHNLSARGLVAGAFIIGIAVTLLETVCTGQVYLPTLVFMTNSEDHGFRAWQLLVVYNMAFVAPLIVIFAAAYSGTSNQRLLSWSRRNVVWGKAAMGLLFLFLAAGILVLWTS